MHHGKAYSATVRRREVPQIVDATNFGDIAWMNSLLVDSRQNQSKPNFLNSGIYGIAYCNYTKDR
jgi:hypothetical protein